LFGKIRLAKGALNNDDVRNNYRMSEKMSEISQNVERRKEKDKVRGDYFAL